MDESETHLVTVDLAAPLPTELIGWHTVTGPADGTPPEAVVDAAFEAALRNGRDPQALRARTSPHDLRWYRVSALSEPPAAPERDETYLATWEYPRGPIRRGYSRATGRVPDAPAAVEASYWAVLDVASVDG
jgi:hypothetical protein